MPKATSARRRLVVYTLLGLAVLGGAMRLGTVKESVAYDIGNLLLVLWVPVIGNVVAFVIRRTRQAMEPARAFARGSPFTGHLLVELSLAAGDSASPPQGDSCALVVGTDGFTARAPGALAQWMAPGQARTVELELLRPELALQRLLPATSFGVLLGPTLIGRGRVLEVLPQPTRAVAIG